MCSFHQRLKPYFPQVPPAAGQVRVRVLHLVFHLADLLWTFIVCPSSSRQRVPQLFAHGAGSFVKNMLLLRNFLSLRKIIICKNLRNVLAACHS